MTTYGITGSSKRAVCSSGRRDATAVQDDRIARRRLKEETGDDESE